ncbi:hypothetical protein DL769_005891 [Monosporascus sp. CRB-8-3]|nr:hypothetical protein DL769_005891 [Monosporascus sp. CRB-8-3]
MLRQVAYRRGSQLIVDLPREDGTSANSQRENGVSELFKAARVGNASRVEELLAQKDNSNWLNRKGGQTVLFAAVNGALSVLKGKLKPDDLQKLLEQYRSVVEHLLAAGARVNETDSDEGTPFAGCFREKSKRPIATAEIPLIYAAINGHMELAELLLERRAIIERADYNGRTPWILAATNGNAELTKLLLDRNANVRVGNSRRPTGLHLAAESNREEVVNYSWVMAQTPRPLATVAGCPCMMQHGMVTKLSYDSLVDSRNPDTNEKINLNAQLYNEMISLHWAAFRVSEEVVWLLLATRPAVNIAAKDSFGRTLTLCAAEKGFTKLAMILSPAYAAGRLSRAAREACDRFEATVIDFKPGTRKQLLGPR